jgi:deoxyribonuclease V
VVTDIPAIGVAKTRLCGTHGPVPEARGAWTPLRDGQDLIGAVLRTRVGAKPLFISPGHRISLNTAIHYVMACCTRYRLPETTRQAHRLASVVP